MLKIYVAGWLLLGMVANAFSKVYKYYLMWNVQFADTVIFYILSNEMKFINVSFLWLSKH